MGTRFYRWKVTSRKGPTAFRWVRQHRPKRTVRSAAAVCALGWIISALSLASSRAAEDVKPEGASKTAGSETGELKGFMKGTRIVQAEGVLTQQLAAVRMKLKQSSPARQGHKGVQTLAEAAEFISTNVSMACPPGACVEYDGMFFFSGGTSTSWITNFSAGLAIRRGDTAIMVWEAEESEQRKPAPRK